ncbi:MAG TPA: PEP-CTERM sorting domain-containing protein [Rhizomicrobium sp.]|jgi:hypothetical protein
MRAHAKCLILAAALMLSAGAAQADFIGDQFSQTYYYPDAATPYGGYVATNSNFTAPFNGELGVIESVTTLNGHMTADKLTISFDTTLNDPTFGNQAFNGLFFTVVGPSTLNISNVIVLPGSLAGFDASRVSYTSTSISLNWAGLPYNGDTELQLQFTFAPPAGTPEPASIALLGAGLLGMGWGARRKRA